MCWNGHSGQKKVAEKDIEVYKIGRVRDNRFICEFRNFSYKKGVPNKELVLKETRWMGSISINEGYHSYLTEEMAKCSRDEYDEIGIFEIPAGATIYVNYKRREVVSTDIKYLGLLEE